jgi:hypothetical protein
LKPQQCKTSTHHEWRALLHATEQRVRSGLAREQHSELAKKAPRAVPKTLGARTCSLADGPRGSHTEVAEQLCEIGSLIMRIETTRIGE